MQAPSPRPNCCCAAVISTHEYQQLRNELQELRLECHAELRGGGATARERVRVAGRPVVSG